MKSLLIKEMLQDHDGDSYGWAMSWAFAIADDINFNREDVDVPVRWKYHPSPFGPDKDDTWKTDILKEFSNAAVLHAGKVLMRYIALLKRHGEDY